MTDPTPSTSPEQLKEQIELTRADLAVAVDALADKVTPSRGARRLGLAGACLLLVVLVTTRLAHRKGS